MKWLVTLLFVALGVVTVILGGADDSPGLQFIGLLIVVGAIALRIRSARRQRDVRAEKK